MKSPREIAHSFLHATKPLTPIGIGRPGIRVKEALAYILAFTLAVVLVGVFLLWHLARHYEGEMASWRARLSSVADDQAQRVSDWLKERQGDAQVLSASPAVRSVLRADHEDGQLPHHPSGGLAGSLGVLDEMAKWYSYAGVYVLDRDAHVVAQSSRSIPLNPVFSESCRAIARSGVARIDVVGDAPNRNLMGFGAPVFAEPGTPDAGRPAGQPVGTVLVVSDAMQTFFPLVTREVAPTRTGETLLVSREGNDIVFFSPLRNVAVGSQSLRFPLSTAPAPVRLALEGHEAFVNYNDYRGVPVLAATQHIALTGWGLVHKIDRAEALKDFRRQAIVEGLAGSLLIILLAGVLLFHRRYVLTRVLKQEEEKFRTFLESAPDAVYIIEPSTLRILGRNRRAAEMDEYNDEEIAHMTAADLHPSEDHTLLREWFARGSKAGGVLHLLTLKRKDGELVPVEESQTLVDAGDERFVLSLVHDITERKRAEKALIGERHLLHTLMDNLPDVIYFKDRESRFTRINEAHAKLFGLSDPAQAVGKTDFDFFGVEHAQDAYRDEQEIIRTGQPIVGKEEKETWPDGRETWVSSTKLPLRDANGNIIGTFGVSRDVTQRKLGEVALRESEGKYRSLVSRIPDVAWTADSELNFTFISKNMEKVSGYSQQEVYQEGAHLYLTSLHPDDVHLVRDGFRALFTEGRPFDVECRVKRKDGNWIWVHDRALATYEKGGIRYADGLLSDITERKQAEARLKESGEKFRKAFMTGADAFYIATLDEGLIMEVNDRFQEVFGYRSDEVIGKTFIQLNLYADSADRARMVSEVKSKGYVRNMEIRARRKGGEIFPLLISVNLLQESGEALILGVIRDITERRLAEEALRLTQFSVEHASDAIFWMDPQGQIVYVNDAACRSLECSQEELLALSIPDIDPLFPKEAWGTFWEEIKPRGSMTFETQHRTKHGRVFPVEITANYLEFNGKEYSFAFARDITERQRAEAEHVRLVTAIEQSAEAVVITNPAGDIEYVNPAFTRITGYGREEVLGQNPRILKSDKQDPAFYQQLWATISKGQTWHGELINRRKDGKLYNEAMNIAPVRGAHGEVTHYIATKQDVTERKTLEVRLQQAAKMEAVGRLAGGVAHDFNNLLTIINGYSALVLDRLNSDDPMRGHLHEIMKAGDRAASLTRQMLAFSRQQVLAPRVLDLNALVADVEKMLRRLIGEDIDLAMVRDSALGQVKADRGQIEQILMNLAVNARDAMPEGGKLVIETANVELDDTYADRHTVVTPGRYVMLAVTHTGIGMDAETQSHIFEPFFTTKEKGSGTGLGLAMVYGTVKQSGGYVWVYSELGQGTTFKIYLPRVEEVAESVQGSEVRGRSVTGSETILLVEDEGAVRALATSVLQDLGYKVLASTSPEDALHIGERHTGAIDLLLTDVVLLGMSGWKVAEHLAFLRPTMKILYMSGHTDYAVARHGVLEAGTAFLRKPFTPASLARKVREVLDAGREQSS
jgi:PAS domain S-box-containing protein